MFGRRLSGPRVERLLAVSGGREPIMKKTEAPSLPFECKEESRKVQILVRFVLESMCQNGGQVCVIRIAVKCVSQISIRALDGE